MGSLCHTPPAPPVSQEPTQQQRWVNDGNDLETKAKIQRLHDQGYRPVIHPDTKQPVTRHISRDGNATATLYSISKVKRNMGAWLDLFGKNRSPSVLARIMRLNPTIEEGARIRGWNPAPTLKARRIIQGVMGKREFIQRHGREAWDKLVTEGLIIRDGKRAYVGHGPAMDAWTADKNSKAMQVYRSVRRKPQQ